MSRIGKQKITIPTGVDVKVEGDIITVKGPKGQLTQQLHNDVSVNIDNGIISVKVEKESDKQQRSLWGLFSSLIANMVIGVTEGYSKQLEINGVGFKAAIAGKKLTLNVGFSHPVDYEVPEGIDIKVEGNLITITGIDKQMVGEVAAQIRKVKKPEPYKGKGIKYIDEQIRRKAGKAAASKE